MCNFLIHRSENRLLCDWQIVWGALYFVELFNGIFWWCWASRTVSYWPNYRPTYVIWSATYSATKFIVLSFIVNNPSPWLCSVFDCIYLSYLSCNENEFSHYFWLFILLIDWLVSDVFIDHAARELWDRSYNIEIRLLSQYNEKPFTSVLHKVQT